MRLTLQPASTATTTMKLITTSTLSLLAATAVLAVPTSDQVILNGLGSAANEWKDVAHEILREGKQRVTKWVDGGKEFVEQHGLTCEYLGSHGTRICLMCRQTSLCRIPHSTITTCG